MSEMKYVQSAKAAVILLAVAFIAASPIVPGDGQKTAAAAPVKKVLILYPASMEHPFYADFTDSFRKRLKAETSLAFEFSYESMDLFKHPGDEALERAWAEVLRLKYRNARPDLIVVNSMRGVRFLNKFCGDVFGDTPVVAYFTRQIQVDPATVRANQTFCFPAVEPAKNVELILSLNPSVRQLFVIIGQSPIERTAREELARNIAAFSGRVAITYLDDSSPQALVKQAKTIKEPAAILFVDYAAEVRGGGQMPGNIIRSIRAEAQVPIFCSCSTHVGNDGAVGGYVLNMHKLGWEVGEKALVLLQGRAAPGGIEKLNIAEYRFDWAGLQRWGIDEGKLPPGSIVVNKPASVWQSYRWPIVSAVLFMALQTALIALHRQRWRIAQKKEEELRADLLEKKEEIIRERTNELRKSEERFRTIFHNSAAMIAIVSMRDNRFVEANLKFFEVMEYGREELLGRTSAELGIRVDPDDRHVEAMLDDLRKNGELPLHEYKLRTKSGRIVAVLATVTNLQIGDEQCRVSIMQDITEEKRLEADLLRLDRLNLVGEMAAGIGHEVRNPMTTVRGYLQMFQRKDKFGEYKEQLTTMIQELDRANTIISEFLSLAKNKSADLRPGNINASLIALFPLLEAKSARSGHIIDLRTNPVPEVRFDDKELRQLVLNLAHNSFEAMPAGGTLAITTYREKNDVVLAVQDTGCGIPANIADKIGTPFLTTKENGTGLGLSVCYRIAQRHNAKIEFTTGNKGTTFYVKFPAES